MSGRGPRWGVVLGLSSGCAPAMVTLPDRAAFDRSDADTGVRVEDSGAPAVDVVEVEPVVAEADWTAAVEVEERRFEMGCTRDPDWNCYVDEFPVRRVTLRPVVAMRYEVTAGLYADVLSLPSPDPQARHRPVVDVTWLDAVVFANALSERDGLEPAYLVGPSAATTEVDTDASGWRLPTEAEWESLARAGTDHTYSGGEDVLSVAWIDENSPYTVQPVGTRAPNAWGLHDLSGNAWEWTGDWLGPYSPSPETDPEGFVEGTKKVVRGGSVDNHDSYARVSLRRLHRPDGVLPCLSFRLVRTNGPSLRDDPGDGPLPDE